MPPRPAIPKLLQPAIFYRRPVQLLDWCRRRCGPAFTLWVPPWGDVAIFTDPADVRAIFTNDSHGGGLDGGRAYKLVFDMLMGPHSMFAVEGDEHLRLRKLLMKAFRGRPTVDHRVLVEAIAAEEADGWPVGKRIGFEHAMQQLTLAVVVRDVLGVSNPDHERALRRLLPEIVNPGMLIQLEVVMPSIRRFGPGRRWHRVMAETREALRHLIVDRRAMGDIDGRTDTLSLLVNTPDDYGQRLTDEELIDFSMTLLLAGHETTSSQLSWIFELLMRYPSCLKRLCAKLTADDEEDAETYLEAVIMETMRLRPALPYVERGVTEDVEVGGYRLPAGTVVGVGISAAHHTPDIWEDADQFRPERFLDGNGRVPQSWIPWGGGRRRCAGQHFALVEMKAAVATILRRVELAPWRAKPAKPVGKAVTMVPARGTEIVVTRRLLPVGSPPSSTRFATQTGQDQVCRPQAIERTSR